MSITIIKSALHKQTSCHEQAKLCNILGKAASFTNSLVPWKRKAKFPRTIACLKDKWREVHGQSDWANMTHPLDPILRSELIRYGEMTQACYDAFEYNTLSRNCGNCKFTPDNFFDFVGLPDSGYQITRYIYAMSDVDLPGFFKSSNWMGYVAISNDEMSSKLGRRDILISWRGTITNSEWLAVLMNFLQPVKTRQIPSPEKEVKVESGFLSVYTGKPKLHPNNEHSPREQILSEVQWLLNKYNAEEHSITIVGHSLGSALAILNAYDIAEMGLNVKRDGGVAPICVFSFAGPRVGNVGLKERLVSLGVKVMRVVNVHDKVPKVPGIMFNEHVLALTQKIGRMSCMAPWCYTHVGVEVTLDHKESPFLKESNDFAAFHSLETYLHLLDGHHGDGLRFELVGGRDIALVNKWDDFLKESLLVPPRWYQRENAGMIKGQFLESTLKK